MGVRRLFHFYIERSIIASLETNYHPFLHGDIRNGSHHHDGAQLEGISSMGFFFGWGRGKGGGVRGVSLHNV